MPVRCRSARSPARARASAPTSATSLRASTPTTSASCAAPTRRTSRTGSSGATSSPASTSARATSTSTSTRLEFRRRPPVFGRQHQLALDVHQLLQHRRRLQPRRGAVPGSRDPRWPGRARQSDQAERLVLREYRQPQGAVVLLQRQPLGGYQEQLAAGHQSRGELARDLVDDAQSRLPLLDQSRRFAVGDERRAR